METETQRKERERVAQRTSDPLPENTKRVYTHATQFSASVDDVPADFLEENGIDPSELDDGERVYFNTGDEVPLDLARKVWDHFGDLLEPVNGNETEIDPEAERMTQAEKSEDYRWS